MSNHANQLRASTRGRTSPFPCLSPANSRLLELRRARPQISTSALWPGYIVARVQPVQSPGFGLFGLRLWRQQTVASGGTSTASDLSLRRTTSRVEMNSGPRLLQSLLRVSTISTSTRSQTGFFKVSCGPPEPNEQAAASSAVAISQN